MIEGNFSIAVERMARYSGDHRRLEVHAEMPNGMKFYRHTLIIDHPEAPATASTYFGWLGRMFKEMADEARQREG